MRCTPLTAAYRAHAGDGPNSGVDKEAGSVSPDENSLLCKVAAREVRRKRWKRGLGGNEMIMEKIKSGSFLIRTRVSGETLRGAVSCLLPSILYVKLIRLTIRM